MWTQSIEQYLGTGSSFWCREERQIALFLYNILLKKRNGEIKLDSDLGSYKELHDGLREVFDIQSGSIDGSIEIDEVYYEAAILRDYFASLKYSAPQVEFNKKLMAFCFNYPIGKNTEKKSEELDHVLSCVEEYSKKKETTDKGAKTLVGSMNEKKQNVTSLKKLILKNSEDYDKYKKTIENKDFIFENNSEILGLVQRIQKAYFASMIVNAKPDILVIYQKDNGPKCARILECKFESDPGEYKDYRGSETINQLLVQEMIMAFMFGHNDKWDKDSKPMDEYAHKFRDEKRTVEWQKVYKFCEGILKNPNNWGLFNEGIDAPDKRIKNTGIKEVDFVRKSQSNGITIPAEDLVKYMYKK